MEKTFLEKIWDGFNDIFMSAEPGYYENIDFGKSPLFSMRLMILGIFIGAVVACLAMAYNKQMLGKIVRALINSEANSPESAKTLDELGLKKSYLAKNALRSSSTLGRFVKCVGAEEFYAKQRAEHEALETAPATEGEKTRKTPKYKERSYMVDIDNDRFYIPEELRVRADIRYDKKGSGRLATAIAIIALTIGFIAVLLIMPWIFKTINSIVGNFKG